MGERFWAIDHTGGCGGKLHGFTLLQGESIIPAKIVRCQDKDCRVVVVEVKVVATTEIKPDKPRLPTFEEGAPLREG